MENRRPWLKRLSFHVVERRILKHASLVHYASERERTEAECLFASTASAVIPNPMADPEKEALVGQFRARFPQLHGRRVVLFLSRLDVVKGLELLLHAFARVRADVPDAVLVLAGSGDEQFVRELKTMTVSLGIAPEVVWTGFLADGQKQAALADADVFVLPSHSENFGIAVAEAMAAGLPVIVSDQVGIHRDVADARAGLVVPCQVDELANALIRLLHDPALRKAMGRAGACFARQQYSSEAVTRKLISVYNEIAN
jgi:glycosyltransferase involved in cell wall biosynthesis